MQEMLAKIDAEKEQKLPKTLMGQSYLAKQDK